VNQPVTIHSWPVLLGLGGAVLVYLVLNALLFNLGSHPFDMTSQKVWSYIAAQNGILDIYPQASTVSLAKVWNGAPFHEAVFPYPPVMAYYFTGIGWLYRLLVSEPGTLVMDTFSLELLIKTGNLLFGLADGVLIYLILRELRLRQLVALVAAGLFLFNPALWVDMSFWGGTETVSLFFILLSVWLAERDNPLGAWLALGAGILTRPQMAVLALLLGLVYLRKFPWRDNVPAISWSVIVFFLILGPFALGFSPSMPVDYVRRVFLTHVAESGEAAFVALGGYSIWPLVTSLLGGQSGLERSAYPEASSLVGGLSYGEVSNLLLAGVLLAVSAVLVMRPQSTQSARGYLPLVALGMLGWSMLTTGMVSRYFIYALALVIASRASLRPPSYYAIVAVLSVTTLVTIYGSFGFAIEDVPHLAPALHASSNVVTRFFMDLYSADWFITLGILANMSALAWLAWEIMRPLPASRRQRELVVERAAVLE
jgi:hypothetical protein